MSGFKNLKKLALVDIYGDFDIQRARLVLALLASPILTHLQLPVSGDKESLANRRHFFKILYEICKLAADKKGRGPLSLKKLLLGHGALRLNLCMCEIPRIQPYIFAV
jgi:hypothetical protein